MRYTTLVSTDTLEALLTDPHVVVIDCRSQVIAYDQDSGMFASRLWWMLRWLGHDAAAVLDGGFSRWLTEHRPTRSGAEKRPRRAFVAQPRPEMIASLTDMQAVLGL